MHQPNDSPAPPSCRSQSLEQQYVDKREHPSQGHVHEEAIELCFVAVRRKNRSQHIRQVHARQAQSLRSRTGRGQHNRRCKSPDEPTVPIHAFTSLVCDFTSAPVRVAGCSLPRSFSSSVSAALMSPTCVNACGKLPSAAPVPGSVSSANNPRSLPYFSSVSNCSCASSSVPPPSARYSTSQKPQMPNAPSCGSRS